MDTAFRIKQAVTMGQAVQMYVSAKPKKDRIPCPIHNGKDYNFWFNDTHFKCFVCGASGDVISFVQKLFNLSFSDSCKKLDNDFGLGLYKKVKFSDYMNIKKAEQKQKDDEKLRKKHNEEYWNLFKKWVELDNATKIKPINDEQASLYAKALGEKESIEYLLDTWR